MIRHVFTLCWQRKKANALLIFELLLIFLVLFGLSGFGLHLLRLYSIPLGFEYSNTWFVQIETGGSWLPERDAALSAQLRMAVDQMQEVESVHIFGDPPFLHDSGSYSGFNRPELERDPVVENEVSDGLLEALGTQLVEGRWFGPQDEGRSTRPAVVNRALAALLEVDAVVGTELDNGNERLRIVGVFDEFRIDGEFSAVQPLIFIRSKPELPRSPSLTLLLKPGVEAQYEDRLLGVLEGIAPQWDFVISPWAKLRADHVREYTVPLLLGGIVTTFLLLLVGCGMLGVMWQNVIRRMPEMGLRRAVGATAGAVRLQVALELLAMTCMALVFGFIVVVQLPLSGTWQILDWDLFIQAFMTSTLVLFATCALFALYPSYQATRRDPVEALRYE